MNNYTLDISQEECIEIYTRELTLEWVKKHHPEVIEEIKNKVTQELNNELQNI
jgi:hypothetical protein